MDAPYMGLPRCKRCFESLVTGRQEGWALCNEMMKPSAHLTGNFSVKYWSNGPSSLLWTDWRLGCSWSLLGEEDAATVQIGIAYTNFRCLMGSGAQVLAGLETIWRVQIPDLGAYLSCFFSKLLLRWIRSDGVNTFWWALWPPMRCSGKRKEILNSNWSIWAKNAVYNWVNIWLFIAEGGEDLLIS